MTSGALVRDSKLTILKSFNKLASYVFAIIVFTTILKFLISAYPPHHNMNQKHP